MLIILIYNKLIITHFVKLWIIIHGVGMIIKKKKEKKTTVIRYVKIFRLGTYIYYIYFCPTNDSVITALHNYSQTLDNL